MAEFAYTDMFPLAEDTTAYRLLETDSTSITPFGDESILRIEKGALTLLAETAFRDVSHLLRTAHVKLLAKIMADPEASDNDRYVALEMIKNAVIASDRVFPLCQDTGTAIILGKKGQRVWTGCNDAEALARGVFNAYTKGNLRYSQNAPLTMYDEKNTGTNLPAQIDLHAPGIPDQFLRGPP